MSNLGFNHAMGAARMAADLGEMESRRRQAQTEMERLNAQAQGAAVGSLVGTGVGMVKGGYDAYKQDQVDQDVERGIQARKEYGVMTDQSKHFDDRVDSVYGHEGGNDIKDALYRRMGDAKKTVPEADPALSDILRTSGKKDTAGVGVMDALIQRTKRVNAGVKGQTLPSRAAMDELTQLKPRISQTNGILGGKDTQLVSNSPWRDFYAASKYFHGLIG